LVLIATEPNTSWLGLTIMGLVGTPTFALRLTVELPAEVTNVMVVSYVPAGWFAMKGYTYIVQDWPGPRLEMSWTMPTKGFVMQEPALTLKLPGLPVSVSLTSRGEPERFNRLTADAPEFVNVTNCAEKLPTLPVALRPKSSDETEGVGGMPGPTTVAVIGVTLLPVSATISSVAAGEPGVGEAANWTLTVHDTPAAMVAGKSVGQLPPERVKPAPPTFSEMKVVALVAEALSVTTRVEVLLIATAPKASVEGLITNALVDLPMVAFRFTVELPVEVTKVMVVSYVPAPWNSIAGRIIIEHDSPGERLGIRLKNAALSGAKQEPLTEEYVGLELGLVVKTTLNGAPVILTKFTVLAVVFVNVTFCALGPKSLAVAAKPKSSVETEGVGGVPKPTTVAVIGVTLLPVSATISSEPVGELGVEEAASCTVTVHDVPPTIVAGKLVGQVPPIRAKLLPETVRE
jgi:hypothetical protein